MINSLHFVAELADIPIAVKDSEGICMIQYLDPVIGIGGIGRDVKLILQLNDRIVVDAC